jgi:hypothetical protein
MKMLAYRIERFAALKKMSTVKTKSGKDDPVESRYWHNEFLTEMAINYTVYSHIGVKGTSISFAKLLGLFWA